MISPTRFARCLPSSTRADRPTAASASASGPAGTFGPRGRRMLPLLALLALVAGGCRAQERSYPGESPATVWSAARAAAESPDYMSADLADRWAVDTNEVQVDEDAGELEIYRELSRLHLRSGGDRFVERRTWKIGVDVVRDPDRPTVRMVSRGLAVPAHVTAEAERYFDQIAALLRPPVLDDEAETDAETDGETEDPSAP